MLKKSRKPSERQNNSNMEEVKSKPSLLEKLPHFFFKTLLVTLTLALLFFIFFFTNRKVDGIYVKNYLNLFSDFIFTPSNKFSSKDGRINILILGKSGEGYVASDLTDTIMFTSISFERSSVRIVSIPRDIWIPEIRAKLNSAYYWGKQKDNDGFSLPEEIIERILDKPIHYVIVFDFSSFTRIIDVLGGVEVEVERSFKDEKYPIAGRENDLCDGDKTYKCRYEIVSFEEGKQFMDGDTALKFVRSRNSEGEEGTDIAREKRQQKVIYAVKNSILSPKVLFNPKKLLGIWKVLKETVEGNVNESLAVIIGRILFDAKDDIKSSIIPEDLLFNPPVSSIYDNQYVFIPTASNWSEIIDWIDNFLN